MKSKVNKLKYSRRRDSICDHCRKCILRFVDESNISEHRLRTLSDLCEAASNEEIVDADTIKGIGTLLRDHLSRQRILRHYFMGEPIGSWLEDSAFAIGELKRLRSEHQ